YNFVDAGYGNDLVVNSYEGGNDIYLPGARANVTGQDLAMIVNQDGAAYPSHSQLPRNQHTRMARRGRLDRGRHVCSRST
ncbi:hypothetical protein GOA88_26340, partial [Sinorhizobium meliloti]|nr:hypothetical protein [Sinorhizobium meliloti]MDX0072417.1 hypothetical protein [Sinorhizobium meliloti]